MLNKNPNTFLSKVILLLLFSVFFITGCTRLFNPSRYPDLHKVAVNLQAESDSAQALQMQKMKLLHAVKWVKKAEDIVWMNPLGIVAKSNTANHSGVFQNIEKKTQVLKHKLSVASRIRKMIEKQSEPQDALIIVMIILLIFVIGAIIAVIKLTDPTGGMGCLLWGIVILVILGLVFGVIASSK